MICWRDSGAPLEQINHDHGCASSTAPRRGKWSCSTLEDMDTGAAAASQRETPRREAESCATPSNSWRTLFPQSAPPAL